MWITHMGCYKCDPLSISRLRTAPALGKAFHQTFPALVPGSGWLNSKGLGACLALPEVARQPLLDERLDGLCHPPAQEQGRRPSSQKPQDENTTLLAPGTWQLFLSQHPLRKHQWASAQVWTKRPKTPPPRARIAAWPPRCGGPLQIAFPHIGRPTMKRQL
jgi:hypothetical protein